MRTIIAITLLLISCREDKIETVTETEPLLDQDADGYSFPEDCDDTDPAINPVAEETCDGTDNNCNGDIDEGVIFDF